MALVNFTNLDFDQIKTSIKDYLRSNSNFTDYDFEGSNLSVLIDALAYNTYITSYNANMVSNEVFIDSATLRENVVSLARNIGYVPRSRIASRANISFFVDTTGFTTKPLTLTLKKGVVCTSSTSFGGESYTFTISSDITVPVVNEIAVFDNISVYEGTYLISNYIVDSYNLNQKFILNNANIDASTISVTVRDTQSSSSSRKFILSNSLFEVTSTSKIFFIQEIEDQRYELIFGDGVFGEKLQNLNFIEISYVSTNGMAANGISSFTFNGRITDNNNNIVTSGISLITTIRVSESGKEIESVESIKKYAPRIYASQNRAVTSSDYKAIIPQIYPEAESVSVFGGEELDPPQYGKVFITIKPFNGETLPLILKENLKRSLKKYTVAGIDPEILDLKYVYVEYDSTVYYDSNLSPSSDYVKNIIYTNLTKYADSTELNQYAAKFKYSKFQKVIDDSHKSITSNITKIQIRRDLRPVLNTFGNYELCFGNSFYNRVDGYNVKSSGFSVAGISGVVYLSDMPISDTMGEIFLFGLESVVASTSPSIIKRSVGTIDYVKGEIRLKAINITSTEKILGVEPIVEISVVPKSNDIIGLQDLYLQLDINKSNLNMIIDGVSSGSDISGSEFFSTSSYTNGALIRF